MLIFVDVELLFKNQTNCLYANLRVEVDHFVGGRDRRRSRGPVIAESLYNETVREDFDYRPRAAQY
jgi:hypothetical protein